MSNRKETYGFEGQFAGGDKYPEDLTIVGIDCDVSEFPELRDDRVHDPLDPEMVQSVRDHGVRIPIEIRRLRGDDRNFVSYGRHRVQWAREANKTLNGKMRILVPCKIAEVGSDPLTTAIIENSGRKSYTPLQSARLAQRMRERGRSDREIASAFGKSIATVEGWKILLESGTEALTAVEATEKSERVTTEAAKAIADVAPPKRAEAIAAAKGKKGKAAVEAVKRVAKGTPVDDDGERKPLGRAKIRAVCDALAPTKDDDVDPNSPEELAHRLMRVVTGDGTPALLKNWPGVAKAVREALK